MERRIDIDIIKGFGIIAVVIIHVHYSNLSRVISIFSMPLFFMVSGYLYKGYSDEPKYLERKVVSLLIPYCTYLFLFKISDVWQQMAVFFHNVSLESARDLFNFILPLIWGGRFLQGSVGVFWFISCLFFTQQIYNIIYNRIRSKKKMVVIAAISYLLAYLNQHIANGFVFPWSINVVACSLVFYTIGHVFGKYLFDNHHVKKTLVALLIAFSATMLTLVPHRLSFSMKTTYYGWFIVSLLASLAFVIIISNIAMILKNIKIVRYAILSCGKASITIMFVHKYLCSLFGDICKQHPLLMIITIMALSVLIHQLLQLNKYSRIFLLGSLNDFNDIKLPQRRG